MKKLRLNQLPDNTSGHFLKGVIPGEYICQGAMTYKKPGERTHTEAGSHVHDDREVFVILQGRARMEVDGQLHPMTVGDVFIIDPGEDHHLIADPDDPPVTLWLHAGPVRHPDQK